MQGQKGVIGSLPESLALEHGSGSSDSGVVEQQICWNNYMQNPVANTNQENQSVSMWSMGESSSSSLPNQANQNWTDPETEHEWPLLKACPEPLQLQPPSSTSMLSFGDVNTNITRNHANNSHHGPLFTQSSRPESVPHNVNTSTFIGLKPSIYAGSIASSSSSEPFELEGRQLPCKRKAVELSIGQSSSGIGSSNVFERPPTNSLMPSDPIIPRLGLGVNGGSSDNNHNVENTRRNVRIRINTSRQQDPLPASVTASNTNGQSNVSASYPSLRLNPVDLQSPPIPTTTENLWNNEGQPIVSLRALRRNLNLPSRWNRSSSSRAHRSSNIAIPGDTSRALPTNISEHPIFFQPRNTTQTTSNWGLNNGGDNVNNNENHIGVASNAVPAPAPSSATSNLVTHRGSPHYSSRRLSEILRRSLLPSLESGAGGGQSGNLFSRSSDRHHDRVFGVPSFARAVAGGSEGRGRLVSEIRNVLDLIRRGEGLRFEDVMILDQSLFHGMADIHDRHRDMRLDIDNMSYEELLALEERIGNVNTGLTEEIISSCLKQKTFAAVTNHSDAKPCCICQEEYNDGDELGALECGHDFHTSCIKQWLLQKNSCPVCKSAASATTNGK